MTKAAKLNNATNYLRHQVGSLKSCKRNEIANEKRLLIDAMNDVKACQADVKGRAFARSVEMLGTAMDVMAQRVA